MNGNLNENQNNNQVVNNAPVTNGQNTNLNNTPVQSPVNNQTNQTQPVSNQTPQAPSTVNTNPSQQQVQNTNNMTVQENTKMDASKLRIGGKKVTYSFDSSGNIVNSQMLSAKESKSSVKFVLIFFGILLLVIYIIPNIYTKLNFSKTSSKKVDEKADNFNLIDDKYITIGQKAHVTITIEQQDEENTKPKVVKTKIKFYNFVKETSRAGLKFNVQSDYQIPDVKKYNLAIKVYDESKNLIHVGLFNPSGKINTSVRDFYAHLSTKTFKDAHYAEVTTYEETSESKLTCTMSKTAKNVTVKREIVYNFVGNMLVSYEVSKEATGNSENIGSYITEYEKELNSVTSSEIVDKDSASIDKTDSSVKISYAIDLRTYKQGANSRYEILYEYGDVYNYINKTEKAAGWTCN